MSASKTDNLASDEDMSSSQITLSETPVRQKESDDSGKDQNIEVEQDAKGTYEKVDESISASEDTHNSQVSDVSAPKTSSTKSPVEIKVYNDRQQLVLDKYLNNTPSSYYCAKSMLRSCFHSSRDTRTSVYNPLSDFLNRSLLSNYPYPHHYADSIYESRKGYHSYRVHPYPQPYYQYSVMPAGNNVRVQPSVKHSPSRIKPLMRSPISPAALPQKCSPLAPSPISPSFLSPTNSLAWSPITEWDKLAKVTPPYTVSEWNRLAKATPPSPPINECRVTKATLSPVVNSSPISTLSNLTSPIANSNGFHDTPWSSYHQEHQPHCGCKQSNNGHYSTQHNHQSNVNSGYAVGVTPPSPHQSKQQEEYARKLYSLRHALKSDVFMGYGKNTERYELYADDRPVSPVKLLEIDCNLDWSDDLAAAISEVDKSEAIVDDEFIFYSIKAMSEALTR